MPRLVVVAALAGVLFTSSAHAGALDSLRLRGLLDVTAAGGTRAVALNRLNNGDSNFDPYRLRIFLDAPLEGGFSMHFQSIVIGQNYALLQYGAYARWAPSPAHDLQIQAGFIPWAIGTWAPLTYSNVNPLIGMPMLYQLHGTLSFAEPPPSADALLAAAGSGEFGVDYGNGPNARGVPIVYDRCWDAGVVVIGSQRPVEYALGLVQGSPSWPQNAADQSPGKTVLGRIGFLPTPELRVGLSAAQGPWMPAAFQAMAPGVELERQLQRLLIADLEVERGRVEFRGEGYVNEWQTPFVGRLDVRGMWAEAKVGVLPGTWLAVRGEARRHSQLADSTGARRPWDHDRDRWETGVGYRATRQATIKAVWQRNLERISGASSRRDDLFAASLSLAF
jgi:hypothetical protein